MDASLLFLKLAVSTVALATAVVGLLREVMLFAKALVARQKKDDR